MATDKKLETLSEEIKLLKGELKQSLASVRDYLLNMELPTSEFSTIMEALESSGTQKVTMSGNLGNQTQNKSPEEATKEAILEEELPSESEDLIGAEDTAEEETGTLPEGSFFTEEEDPNPDEEIPENEPLQDELEEPVEEDELPEVSEEESPLAGDILGEFGGIGSEPVLSTPKVNMLANLIGWVARAKREIGYDQLPVLLEVYGISGHLSSELKEVILHLAEITPDKPEVPSDPQIWSQAMLSLHGILTGGDAPLHPVIAFSTDAESELPAQEEETAEEAENPKPPFKLKLVLPDGEGQDKEFCINLTPEVDKGNGSAKKSKNR
jgi:hypothetical protein